MSSVAAILQQLAENAGRTQRVRGAIYGDLIAGASQVPAQILADRERLRRQQVEEARQAEQLGFQRSAEARAQKDQAFQDTADTQAVARQAALKAGIAAGFGDETDPKKFDTGRAAKAVTDAGFPDLVSTIGEVHRKMLPTLTSGAPGSVMRDESGQVVPGSAIPREKPDYTVNGQRFSGDGTPIGPVVASQVRTPAPAAIGSLPDYLTRKAKEAGKNSAALTTAEIAKFTKEHTDATQKTPVLAGMNALYSEIDPKAIAAQIRLAKHPPDISQYGRPAAAAIASELAKKGPNGELPFDLSAGQREWKAQLRLNATMNGSQQVRLDESIRSGLAMYDQVDALAEQWDGMGIGPLSRVNLAAARDGLKGKAAASIANQLTGQIGQLTSDIATIEQGGLTPTNESRHIAEQSMQAWWGKGTIKDMTAQGRYNMQIRHTARETQTPMVPGNVMNFRPAAAATPASVAVGPDLSGLAPGHARTFSSGPYAGQTWTIGPDGKPVKK